MWLCLSHSLCTGYKVITFKNPYLGNTCVPFQHWACSLECARAVEIPARKEQISAARQLDQQYEDYIKECMRKFTSCRSPRHFLSFGSRETTEPRRASWRAGDGTEGQRKEVSRRRRRREREKNKIVPPSDSSRTNCGCVLS